MCKARSAKVHLRRTIHRPGRRDRACTRAWTIKVRKWPCFRNRPVTGKIQTKTNLLTNSINLKKSRGSNANSTWPGDLVVLEATELRKIA